MTVQSAVTVVLTGELPAVLGGVVLTRRDDGGLLLVIPEDLPYHTALCASRRLLDALPARLDKAG